VSECSTLPSVKGSVLSGALPPGARFPTEKAVMDSFGVSRTVVREALQQLAARGLVHSVAGSGSYVASSNLRDLERCLALLSKLHADQNAFLELLDLRLLIETELAGRLAAGPTAESLAALRKALAAMKANVDDCEAFASADTAFHRAIVDGVGHELFGAIWKPLAPLARRYGLETYDSKTTADGVIREHRAILRNIAEGNVDGAREAMQEHLMSSRRHFLELTKQQSVSNGNAHVVRGPARPPQRPRALKRQSSR
jgi:GntR family transcriptional repressor for pyruvate dehydrogenase complex